MEKVAEDNLIVGVEYYLDKQKRNKGIFVKIEKPCIFFNPTEGDGYGRNVEGLISFMIEDYAYEKV